VRDVKEIREKFGAPTWPRSSSSGATEWRPPASVGRSAGPFRSSRNRTMATGCVGEDLTLLSRGYRLRPEKILPMACQSNDAKKIEKYNASILPATTTILGATTRAASS